uniref:Uncharacterized protein n=1 Tax=Tanacetum cinerariifolium TaxID=118510 RepID=A0A6L2N1H9_TANCI|nr:hypothetical protein [Tanacetum cinerariifolium]
MQPKESLVTESTALETSLVTKGATLEASLVTEGAALEASLVTKGIAMDGNLVAKERTNDFVTSSELLDECNNSIEKKDKPQESLVTEGTTLEASLVTKGATLEGSLVTEGVALEASLVTKGIAMDDNFVAKESTNDFVTSSELLDECNSSMEKKDTVTLCSYLGEQRMKQLQMEAIRQK